MSRTPEWTVGDRMRKALDVSGLSHGDMAERLGVSQSAVSSWVNGHRNPKRATLEMWARECGVDSHWLVTGDPR